MDRKTGEQARRSFPRYGWIGLGLVAVFWTLNWTLEGPRTHWCFFPLWLGYCLAVDALARLRRGSSLIARSPGLYVALFVISVPAWWLFEAINQRVGNWHYLGRETLGPLAYAGWASLSFSTVVPAVLGTAELWAGTRVVGALRAGPLVPASRRTATVFALSGLATFAATMTWPRWFFPFVWLSLYFLAEAVNIRRGHRSVAEWTGRGDWRPVAALALGALSCGFFWELWNSRSWPKWIYTVPFFGFWKVFEMPLAGYLGYVPFALELFALVHLALGMFGRGRTDFVGSGLTFPHRTAKPPSFESDLV